MNLRATFEQTRSMESDLRAIKTRGLTFRPGILGFLRDQSGSYLIMSAFLMPVLIGMVALGTEVGLWLYKRQSLQAAADSAAISAATSYYYQGSANIVTEADAVAAAYGFVDGANSVTISVSQPPTSGNYIATPGAIEVVVHQPQLPMLAALFNITQVNVHGRAVAVADNGTGCTLSLNRTARGGTTVNGTAQVVLNGCDMYDDSNDANSLIVGGSGSVSARSVNAVGEISGTDNITVTQDIASNQPVLPDPYRNVPLPNYSGCDYHNFTAKSTLTISAGVYCGGLSLNAGASVSLNPGIYIFDQGSLTVNGGASITGDGVTLVFTSSNGHNYATASINGGASVNLVAPTSGPTQGIVLFGDRNMPAGASFKFNGGATQYFGGAMYLPKGAVDFAGGANTATGCTQLIGDTVTFTGNSNLSIDCSNYKIKPVGSAVARLVE
jgi:Flp pilus assembly protein TadG